MIAARPCSCDRFTPGHLYRAGRDCASCWMFAHRPAARRVWGGNPDECRNFLKARPDMPAAELAELLAGPPVVMPDGWKLWPVTREAHLLLVRRFLAEMPSYPEGRFSGRGAVICGGGAYEASTYVACRMLRHVGWTHPIQVWHRGAAEPVSERVRQLPGVEVIDSEAHPAREGRRVFGGWESKTFAVLNSPFEEVLFLDADCYPVYDPDDCFGQRHNPHGIVTWPDTPVGDEVVHWPSYGLSPDGKTGLNGGHYVFTKRRAWKVLQLAAHYDNHSDYYYWRSVAGIEAGAFGDQEQVRVALHKLGTPYPRYTDRPLACDAGVYIQAGPYGRPLFVHRFYNKFAPAGVFPHPVTWQPTRLPMEATAWRFFTEWLTAPASDHPADEVPGWFTRGECDLWRRSCRDRDVLELGRHYGRSTVAAALSARGVVSLDRASAWPADLWLQRYGVRHKAWLREGEFADLVPTSGGPFSACLIDGAHDRWNVERDIATVTPHLAPGAVVAFHDYDDPAFPDVQVAADRAAEHCGWRLLESTNHLAVFVTGSPVG